MWLFGVSIMVGYYCSPTVHDVLESIGEFKLQVGWAFSIVSTAVFGGLIPAIVSQLFAKPDLKNDRPEDEKKRGQQTLGFVVASTLLWAYKGLEIDCFYQFQAWVFGTAADFQTIVLKTVCDQLLMVPVFGMVNVILFYHWRECGYSFKQAVRELGENWYAKRVLPALIANWFIWIPAVSMIYCLPTALQLPVQNLILCFWVLILVVFTDEE